MLTFCAEAIDQGLRVELVLCKDEGRLKALVPEKLRIIDLRCTRTAHALPKLARYLKRTKPSALYTTVRNTNVIAICAAKLSGLNIPVIVRESSTPLSSPKGRSLDHIAARLIPWTYGFAHAVIAVSSGVADELLSMSSSLEGRIKVIPSPVISREMLRLSEASITHPWFSSRDMPVIVCAARIERYKGYETLLSAFESLRKRIDAKLVILGNGTLMEATRHKVAALGLSQHVDFLGFVVNPFPYMKHAQACVLASEHEGLPNVLIQAMAFGTPVVSTDCKSGPREILCDGRFGQLVEVGNEAALASALERAVTLPRQTEAQRYVHEKYSACSATSAYLSLAGLRGTPPH
jgi:glycosyltransferase involved in cell wall biosynthesis